ncbi:hypothetical protein F4778DRAFT_785984 [Xylariomycetidae sp. FL2044]|nr:hypothetical protein F4778DRAFT_785984 [Xylariomycetidae sp. FL2044]
MRLSSLIAASMSLLCFPEVYALTSSLGKKAEDLQGSPPGDTVDAPESFNVTGVDLHLPLPISKWGCTTAPGVMDGWATSSAEIALQAWCGHNEIEPRGNIVFHNKLSTWYVCTWGDRNRCGADELSAAWDFIDDHCGLLAGGYVVMQDWAKTYGRQLSQGTACGVNVGNGKEGVVSVLLDSE